MEGHNYEQAIADFEDCLSKRIAALPSGSRSIAETHYWHGVALAHMDKWSEAETALNKALDQIDARIHTIELMEPSEHMTHGKEGLEDGWWGGGREEDGYDKRGRGETAAKRVPAKERSTRWPSSTSRRGMGVDHCRCKLPLQHGPGWHWLFLWDLCQAFGGAL